MGGKAPWGILFLIGPLVLAATLAQTDRQNEHNQPTQGRPPEDDDGALLSVHQIQRPQDPRSTGGDPELAARSRGSFSREAMRERLDSILMTLSRISDRMVAMETQQLQHNERIDNINYRITKLDVRVDETKGKFSEAWNTLQHRLISADREMGTMSDLLDDIKTTVSKVNTETIQLSTRVELMGNDQGKIEMEHQLPRLKSLMTEAFLMNENLRQIQKDVDVIKENVTHFTNNTGKLARASRDLVTKQDLHLSLLGLKEELGDWTRPFVSFSSVKRERKTKRESSDCWELLHKRGKKKSGVYRIQPQMSPMPFFVYCDMETDGGGWTVIQRREDGTEDFKRGWKDYKYGFGNLAGEFWMGNEKIFAMTNEQVNELRIKMVDFSQTVATASYKSFAIGPETEGYALRLLSAYSGDAGDSLRYHVGQKWSTYDLDNDGWPDKSCAQEHTGAWWYRSCDTSNLNGMYLHGPTPPGDEYKGIYWYDFHGPQYSLWQATMMIRRGGYTLRRNLTLPANTEHSPFLPHPLEVDTRPNMEE